MLPDPKERKPTILIVEDEALVRMSLSDFLQECGFKVLEAANADAAILAFQATTTIIDVVLTDVRMPGTMDGFGLAQWVREHRPGIPVLLVSADTKKADAATDLCEKIIDKPFDFHFVLARLPQVIEAAKPKS
ncbi:MAG TPA: response regulator [Rhizomicrobium sp.]|nr:response regulator [Rhizomicrobium sp.]